ncbi:MAG: hypothetical protein ACYDC6_11000 [Acidobacteriaceae bacterium]
MASDGSGIGGVDPVDFLSYPVPGKKPRLFLVTVGNSDPTGKGYPAFMWYPAKPRPMLSESGVFSMRLDYMFAGNVDGLNVIETDTILVYQGHKYNLSGQYNKTSGFQIANAAGGWVNTGINPPMLPGVKYRVVWEYAYDAGKLTSSVTAITCNGARWEVPLALQNVAASPCNWTPGVYPQIQLGSMPCGLLWCLKVSRMQYAWG